MKKIVWECGPYGLWISRAQSVLRDLNSCHEACEVHDVWLWLVDVPQVEWQRSPISVFHILSGDSRSISKGPICLRTIHNASTPTTLGNGFAHTEGSVPSGFDMQVSNQWDVWLSQSALKRSIRRPSKARISISRTMTTWTSMDATASWGVWRKTFGRAIPCRPPALTAWLPLELRQQKDNKNLRAELYFCSVMFLSEGCASANCGSGAHQKHSESFKLNQIDKYVFLMIENHWISFLGCLPLNSILSWLEWNQARPKCLEGVDECDISKSIWIGHVHVFFGWTLVQANEEIHSTSDRLGRAISALQNPKMVWSYRPRKTCFWGLNLPEVVGHSLVGEEIFKTLLEKSSAISAGLLIEAASFAMGVEPGSLMLLSEGMPLELHQIQSSNGQQHFCFYFLCAAMSRILVPGQ